MASETTKKSLPTSTTFSFRQPFGSRSSTSSSKPRASMQKQDDQQHRSSPGDTSGLNASSPARTLRSKVPLSASMSQSLSRGTANRSRSSMTADTSIDSATFTTSLGKRRESFSSLHNQRGESEGEEAFDEFGMPKQRTGTDGHQDDNLSNVNKKTSGANGKAAANSQSAEWTKRQRSETIGPAKVVPAPPTSTRLPISNSLRASIARPRTTSLLSDSSRSMTSPSPSQQKQQQQHTQEPKDGRLNQSYDAEADMWTKKRLSNKANKEPPSSFKMPARAQRASMPAASASASAQQGATRRSNGPQTPSSLASSSSAAVPSRQSTMTDEKRKEEKGGECGVKERAKAWECVSVAGTPKDVSKKQLAEAKAGATSTPALLKRMEKMAASEVADSPLLIRGSSPAARPDQSPKPSHFPRSLPKSASTSASLCKPSRVATVQDDRKSAALPTPEARQRGLLRIGRMLEVQQKRNSQQQGGKLKREEKQNHSRDDFDEAEAALQREYVAMANKANLTAAEMKGAVTQQANESCHQQETLHQQDWPYEASSPSGLRQELTRPSTPAQSERDLDEDEDDDQEEGRTSPSEEARQRRKEISPAPSHQQKSFKQSRIKRSVSDQSVGLDVTLARLALERDAELVSLAGDESLLLFTASEKGEGDKYNELGSNCDDIDEEHIKLDEREWRNGQNGSKRSDGWEEEQASKLRKENESLIEELRQLREQAEAAERERETANIAAQSDKISIDALHAQLEAESKASLEERSKWEAYKVEVERKRVQEEKAKQLSRDKLREALAGQATMAWTLASSAARAEIDALSGERDLSTFLLAQLTVWQRAVIAEMA